MTFSRLRLLLSALAFAAALHAMPCHADDQLAPNFEGNLLSGEPFKLEDHIGKDVVVLNFFTTDCAPCRQEMPALDKYYADHKKDGVVLIGVDVIESTAQVKSFVNMMNVHYPILIDDGALTKTLKVAGYPTTIVIGVDGQIQLHELNPIDVNVVLGAHARVNQRLAKDGKAISKDDYLKRQEQAGMKTIHVAAPEVKPVAGSEKDAKKDEIFDIKVASETANQMNVDIDYYYAGDHGTTRVYIDCDPHLADGGAPFGMLPAIAEVGRHVAHAPLTTYDGTPKDAVSTTITCNMASRLDSAQMAGKTIPYKKEWGKEPSK